MPSSFRESSTPKPQPNGYEKGGSIDGQPAKIKQTGDRIDVLHGGDNDNTKGDKHGHLVSKDGLNANYIREPGGWVSLDEKQDNPYEEYFDPNH